MSVRPRPRTVHVNTKPGALQAGTGHRICRELNTPKVQIGHRSPEILEFEAQLEQGSDPHVPGESRGPVDKGGSHPSFLSVSAPPVADAYFVHRSEEFGTGFATRA